MKFKIEIKWGIIFFIVSLIWVAFEQAMGWHDENIADLNKYTFFFAIFPILIYILALLEKRNNFYHGFMTWKQGFFAGLGVTIVVTILVPLQEYIAHTYIEPDYFKNLIEYEVSNGFMTREVAEAKFNMKEFMIKALGNAPLMGILTSAIIAYFMKKEPQAAA